MNEIIVKRIKEARLERGLTQHDLAEHLGRSTASISELERGKVQVTASDLFQIAQLVNKPVEYFFGEQYGEKEIQDLIAVLRKQSPEGREQTIKTTSMLLEMQQFSQFAESKPGQELPIEEVTEFFGKLLVYKKMINNLQLKLDEIIGLFTEELKKQGIDISKFSN
jgi:transcriptional regulator with XRE-family HTH domain